MNHQIAAIVVIALMATGCERAPVPIEKVMPPPPVKPAKARELVLSPVAIGPVTFGTRLAHIEASLGQAIRLDQSDNPECSFVSFKALPKVRFMVEKGMITRADVEPDIANTSGIRVGDTEALLKEKHPTVKVERHEYAPGGHVFTIAGDGKGALLFESDAGKITSVRAGLQPAVSYSEGCA